MPETKQYGIIYADPPWHYDRKHGSGVAENHYPTMSIEEICALPVSELAAKDSALFLWATFPQLNEAFRVMPGGSNIKRWLFYGSNRTGKRIAGFMAWAFGPAQTRRSACWQPEAVRNASVRESISL